MNFKTILCRLAAVSVLMSAATGAMAAQTMYFYIGYRAKPEAEQYKHIFEKKIVAIKYTGDNSYMDKLKADYVDFIKRTHPEYFKAYISNSNATQADFNIRAMAKVQGPFNSEKDALGGRNAEMKDLQERYSRDARNGPVIEVDEYRYKQ